MSETPPPPTRSRWYKQLYVWVLVGIAAGIALGAAAPGVAAQLQPLGDSFVSLIKMVITPVIFVHRGDRHRRGRTSCARSAGSASGP